MKKLEILFVSKNSNSQVDSKEIQSHLEDFANEKYAGEFDVLCLSDYQKSLEPDSHSLNLNLNRQTISLLSQHLQEIHEYRQGH